MSPLALALNTQLTRQLLRCRARSPVSGRAKRIPSRNRSRDFRARHKCRSGPAGGRGGSAIIGRVDLGLPGLPPVPCLIGLRCDDEARHLVERTMETKRSLSAAGTRPPGLGSLLCGTHPGVGQRPCNHNHEPCGVRARRRAPRPVSRAPLELRDPIKATRQGGLTDWRRRLCCRSGEQRRHHLAGLTILAWRRWWE